MRIPFAPFPTSVLAGEVDAALVALVVVASVSVAVALLVAMLVVAAVVSGMEDELIAALLVLDVEAAVAEVREVAAVTPGRYFPRHNSGNVAAYAD